MAAGCWGIVNIVTPVLTPKENLWNLLSRSADVEAHSSVPENLNDLRATHVDFLDILSLQHGLFYVWESVIVAI